MSDRSFISGKQHYIPQLDVH